MSDTASELRSPTERAGLVRGSEILRALVAKELKVKYKRSVLGFFWSLITPLALTGIYLFVFVYIYQIPKKDYIIILLSGLLPWNFFNMTILAATSCLVDNGPLIRKVYFPRVLLPLATVFSNLFNFLIALLMLVAVVIISGRPVWTQLHWLILAVVLQTVLCAGLAQFLSISDVYFRDIQQLISILILVLFFATPIVYEFADVPQGFAPFIIANPLTPIMEMYRAALVHTRPPQLWMVGLGVGQVAVVWAVGQWLFSRLSPNLAKEV